MPTSNRQIIFIWSAIGALALFSLGLALSRIYQVDEAQNLYMARIASSSQTENFFTTAALHLLPLSLIAVHLPTSQDIFTVARLAFLLVFWINILLLALATGVRLRSVEGAWVTLGAATLVPVWDYGIEIRHDNILLGALLLMWLLGRPSGVHRRWRFVCIGALAAALTFVAVKGVLYAAAVSLLVIALPRSEPRSSWVRRSLAWGVGLLGGFVVVRVIYEITGLWDTHTAQLQGFATTIEGVVRIGHWMTVKRLFVQTPLLLALTFAALIVTLKSVRERRLRENAWAGGFPEALLFLAGVAIFAANPTPFPYNLLLVVPFAYLLVARVVVTMPALPSLFHTSAMPWIAGILIFTHAVPFASASARHLGRTNQRQHLLMGAAEALTDPKRDRVYDATGLVVTRWGIQYWWYLHSLSIRSYGKGGHPRLPDALTRRPAAVLIRSYRTDWLPRRAHEFVEAHYVPLADDFWVLGTSVVDEHTWECLQEGRYALEVIAGPDGTFPTVFLEDAPVEPGVHAIESGEYKLRLVGSGRARFVWLGPRLTVPPRLPQADHKRLFVNWY